MTLTVRLNVKVAALEDLLKSYSALNDTADNSSVEVLRTKVGQASIVVSAGLA